MSISVSGGISFCKLKLIKLLALSILVSSCASGTKTTALKNTIFGVKGNLISQNQLKTQWSSVIQATLGKNKAILVKKGQSGKSIYWQGVDATITTKNGRVTQLTGTEVELRKTRLLQSDPLSQAKIINGSGLVRKLDYMPNYLYDIEAKSRFNVVGMQNVNVLGFKRRLLKVQETVFFVNFNHKLTNAYWLDPQTMQVWKSKQYYAPHAKPIILERVFLATTATGQIPGTSVPSVPIMRTSAPL